MTTLTRQGKKGSLLRGVVDKGLGVLLLKQGGMACVWLHLSHVNYSNWFAAVMRLRSCDNEFHQEVAESRNRQALRVDPELPYLGLETWWKALFPVVEASRPARFEIWSLATTGEGCADTPGHLEVDPPHGEELSCTFWPPAAKLPRAAGGRAPTRGPRAHPGSIRPPASIAPDVAPLPGAPGEMFGVPGLEQFESIESVVPWVDPGDEEGPMDGVDGAMSEASSDGVDSSDDEAAEAAAAFAPPAALAGGPGPAVLALPAPAGLAADAALG